MFVSCRVHWSLIVVLNLTRLSKRSDARPQIVHSDSLGLHISVDKISKVVCILSRVWQFINPSQPVLTVSDFETIQANVSVFDLHRDLLFIIATFIDEGVVHLRVSDGFLFSLQNEVVLTLVRCESERQILR
jgi:hypothetical protein